MHKLTKSMIVIAPNKTDPEHLAEVVAEMRSKGAPVIRVIDVAGAMIAIEGSHRLAAASALGLDPVIDIVADGNASDEQVISGLDLDDRGTWTVGELRDYFADGSGLGASYDVIG